LIDLVVDLLQGENAEFEFFSEPALNNTLFFNTTSGEIRTTNTLIDREIIGNNIEFGVSKRIYLEFFCLDVIMKYKI